MNPIDAKMAQPSQNAPVAQWIEQRFPKPRAQVRFLPGASIQAISDHSELAMCFLNRRRAR